VEPPASGRGAGSSPRRGSGAAIRLLIRFTRDPALVRRCST
jgi:hypothetical protein